jgi:hypothetical protein
MALIDDYIADPQRALIDAAADPVFQHFITPEDLTPVVVDLGGGLQGQVMTVKAEAVGRVLRRLLEAAQQAGIDLKDWICSPREFNLCYQLKNALPGVAMTALSDLLVSRIGRLGVTALGAYTAFSSLAVAAVLGKFAAVLAVLGWTYHELERLCNCPR